MNKNNYDLDIGYRIRKSRQRIGMSMKELGKRVGMSESNISRYEKGELSLGLNKVKDFADVLGVTSEYICGWDDNADYEHYSRIWNDIVGDFNLTDDEFIEVANYAKYIVSKRKE